MVLPQINQNKNVRPDNPYDHLARAKAASPGWSWKLFSFSFFILIIVVILFLGIRFGYEPFLNARINSMDEQLDKISGQISDSDQESFVNFYSQVVHLQDILDGHLFFSPFFDLLETHTHSGIFFTNLDYQESENKITLEGFASSFEALGQQLERLDQLESIKKIILSQSNSSENGISFRLLLFPEKSLFSAENTDEAPESETEGSADGAEGAAETEGVDNEVGEETL